MVRKLSTLVQTLSVVLAVVGLVFFFITLIHFEYTQSQVQLPTEVQVQRIEEAKKPQVVEEKPQSQLSTEVREERVEEVQKPQVVEERSQVQIPTVREERVERIDGFDCSQCPRRCAEYSSCDFAKFCAFQCGLYHLDGDGDGVPCEWTAC